MKIALVRTEYKLPDLAPVSDFLFKCIDGFTKDDKRAWNSFWKRIKTMEPGEMAQAEMVFPRSGPYHRRHFKILNTVFEAQERIKTMEQFVVWVKIGAGWVDWLPGAKGGIVPIPKSISYAKADQEEFARFHEAVMAFLTEGHAARFLWKHLGDGADEMMRTILGEFDE